MRTHAYFSHGIGGGAGGVSYRLSASKHVVEWTVISDEANQEME